MNAKSRGRLVFVGLFLLFLFPIGLALALQTPLMHWDPTDTKNEGQLVQPPIDVSDLLDAVVDPPDSVEGPQQTWTLLFLPGKRCGEACTAALDLLARIRLAQGRHLKRVRLVTVIAHDDPYEGKDAPDAIRLVKAPDATTMASLLLRFGLRSDQAVLLVVDPGRLAMMRYEAPIEGSAVRKDLAHLLRWIETGRGS